MTARPSFLALLALALAIPLAACGEAVPSGKPPAIVMTDEALGHYCQMYLADHGGPKAQIHLKGYDTPLWFAQVSDAVAYLRDPEQIAEVRAVYVTDVAKAPSWGDPGRDNWLDADAAVFVVGSRQMGGMGTPEAIPFGSRKAAHAFALAEGGAVVTLGDIPESYVRSMADPRAISRDGHGGTMHGG